MRLAVLPKSFIVVPVFVPEFSLAIWLIIVPFSLVLIAVLKDFGTCTSPFMRGVKIATINT
jgi:hypothetical protein